MTDIISLLSTDGYIMCNKTIIKLYGANCAILIGELCAEYNYYKTREELTPTGSFYSTQANIEANTGLNEYTQRKALKILKDEDIIRVTKQGVPAKNYYWINENKLLNIFSTSALNFKGLVLENLNLNNNNNKNIEKKTNNNKLLLVENPKKKNLYSQCLDLITNYCIRDGKIDTELEELLKEYLSLRFQMTDKPLKYLNQFKGLLNTLDTLTQDHNEKIEIIQQSIVKGWASFYKVSKSTPKYKKDVFSEGDGLSCEQYTEEELEEMKKGGTKNGTGTVF